MKLESIVANMGHAPDVAICTQKQKFQFNEGLLFGLAGNVVAEIKSSGGVLPDWLAKKVAKNGCTHFVNGKCELLAMADCTR